MLLYYCREKLFVSYHETVASVSGQVYRQIMNKESLEILGVVAGCCTTISFLPQVIQTWKSRSVDDISLRMYLLFCLGLSLWLVYGFLMDSFSIIFANIATLSLAIPVLVMKLYFGRSGKR
jgi:MtN3 and saliva related transmembrane protein